MLQEATPPVYEEISDKFANTVKAELPSKGIIDMEYQVPPAAVRVPMESAPPGPVYEDIKFSDTPSEFRNKASLRENPGASFYAVQHGQPQQGLGHPTPEYQIPPDEYLGYPSLSPASPDYGFTLTGQSDMKQEVRHYDTRDVSPAIYDEGFPGRMEAEPPVPPPRWYSYSIHPQHLDTATYTHMGAIQPQLQHQKNDDTTRVRMTSTSSASDVPSGNLQFSLQDLTKEQLLTHVQIIQKSQPASNLLLLLLVSARRAFHVQESAYISTRGTSSK